MTCFPKSCFALNSQTISYAGRQGRDTFSPPLRRLTGTPVALAAVCCVLLATMMATMMIGCAKDPTLQFSSVTTPGAASGDGNEISHADFLKMLDQAYTSYDFIPGFKVGFDVETYLTQNPDQEHFPNSIRFYETPCIASREILMVKGEIRYRNRPEFIQYMQAWEAGTAPTPTEADTRYLADLTHLERSRKKHIFQSVENYCRALGGAVDNVVRLEDDAIPSFFLPVVAHCSMESEQSPEQSQEQSFGQSPDQLSEKTHALPFYFIYNPNILNNSYGFTPEKLRRHQLVPFHQRKQETDIFYGHSTVSMITATDECLKTYPVEFDHDTGVLLYGWDGYFLFLHPEREGNTDDPRIVYFDRYRKNWPGQNTDDRQQEERPESGTETDNATRPTS